jgi:nickel-dependent lactate racemase
MIIDLQCGREPVSLELPGGAEVYRSKYPPPPPDETAAVMAAVRAPIGTAPLPELLKRRRAGEVVIVVSDITRPVPYRRFLGEFCALVEESGVPRDEILILVATGLHRLCSAAERVEMFGPEVVARYRIADHDAADPSLFVELPEPARSGTPVRLNRRFVEAGFRVVTGLVEPHFMAGFSGGRKSVFPGLADLAGLKHFHGHRFLEDPRSRNGNLAGNPLHEESLSVARMAGVDFSLNVVLDGRRRLVRAFAGGLVPAHEAACAFARRASCLPVAAEADVAVTSCGGYPLDATFYQCVKGLVSVLPAVKPGGTVIAAGGCESGIGGPAYEELMMRYSGRWRDFLADIRRPDFFIKDQWQFQMHCRALERVGEGNLRFVTPGLPRETIERLSVTPQPGGAGEVRDALQGLIDSLAGKTFAVFPEGPYCAPVRD